MMKNRRHSAQETVRSGSPELPPSSPSVPPPPLEWADHPERLGPLLRHNSLPFVVTCDRRGLTNMENINFDFTQPLLLHTRRTVRKVVASNLLQVQNGGTTQAREVGDRLLIPEDYKGWFAVLGSPEEAKSDKVIPHFRQVAKLALSKCQSFLIGGNEPVSAVQIPSPASGVDCLPQPRLLYPGDVLRMGMLYSAETTHKVKTGPFHKKKTVKKEEKFLMCTDEHDRDVYLPVEKCGMFYVLTIEGQVTPKIPILRMPDVISRFRFPCVVKLLYGRVPPTPCSFTGTLLLQDSHIEASVIGCTMLNLRNILLDIPIDSDLRFYMAHNTPDMIASRAYKSALRLCQEKTSTYMRNMKVAYYVGNEDEESVPQRGSRSGSDSVDDPVTSPPTDFPSTGEDAGFWALRGSIMAHRPSVVEEQELFVPSDPTPQTPPLMTGRKSKKITAPSPVDNFTSSDALSKAVHSGSPTVLRKDTTFELPEPREVLPFARRVVLSPALNSPELQQLPAVNETSSNGHYMTMDETEIEPTSVAARGGVPTPPSKPKKPAPPTPCKPANNMYEQVWNENEQQGFQESPIANAGFCDASQSCAVSAQDSETSQKPALRPKHLVSTPPVAHRVSSIAFADNYLTFPVFKAESSRSVARPQDTEQLYEIMHSPKEKPAPNPTPRKFKPLPLPPRPSLQPASTHSTPLKDKPVLVPPSPERKVRTSVSESSSATDRSDSVERLQTPRTDTSADTGHWSPDVDTYTIGRSVLARGTSYTYYEGYDPAVEVKTRAASPKDDSLSSSLGSNEDSVLETSYFEDVIYENFTNLQCVTAQKSTSGCDGNEGVSDTGTRDFIMLENPPAIFGYVSPPPPRPTKHPGAASMESLVPPIRPPFQMYSNLFGRPLPLPPKPCKSTENHPYLNPCEEAEKGLPELPQDSLREVTPECRDQLADMSQHSDAASRASCEDDLPLGATFANFRSSRRLMSDSGCPLESVAESGDGAASGVSSLSVAGLSDALKNCGLRPETIETLRNEKVDGRLLLSLDEDELREALPGVKSLDIRKICMFVNGWRPVE